MPAGALDRRRLAGDVALVPVCCRRRHARAHRRRHRSPSARSSLLLDRSAGHLALPPDLGRSQVVRQRVLVPRSQVRILAPQPSPPHEPTRLAAVVMAGGLGTRMRSATPKHLHPLLGRRMLDWVLEAARAGARPARRRRVAADARRGRRRRGRRRPGTPLGTGDAVPPRARRSTGTRRATCSFSPATRRSSPGAPRDLLETHRARGRRRDDALVRARRGPRLRTDRPRRRRSVRAIVEAVRDPRGARDPRAELLDLRLPRRATCGRRSSGSTPATHRASST